MSWGYRMMEDSPDGNKWNLDKLKKEGKLHRIGSDRGGSWEVVK